jgi:glycosyltransferase involved in cell wall biosynthesis
VKHVSSTFTLYFCPTILWGGFEKGSDPLDLAVRMYLVKKLKYDIILAFDSRPAVILPAVYAKLSKKVPLFVYWTDWFGRNGIITERSGKIYRLFFEKIETFFEEYFRRYANGYAVICHTLEKRLRDLGYKKKIHFFPLGCNPTSVMNVDKNLLRNKLGLPQNGPLIGCVGSLFPSDAELLFQSFEIVKERVDTKLILIGENHLKNRYRIPYDVIATGRISTEDLQKYVHCCDLMVMPLRNNIANNGRWPSKLNDYLVMGKPVVSTGISVVTELLQIYKFGEIAEDRADDFAQKIWSLLNDKEKLNLYGENALKLASNHLSWSILVDELNRFIIGTIEASSECR